MKGGQGEGWQRNAEGQRFFAYYALPELSDRVAQAGFRVVDAWDEHVAGTHWLSLVAQKTERPDHG